MALSGYKETAIGSHWKLRLEWTATQSISANTSTVTAKLYFIADSYGATSTSASKTASITIAGSTANKSASGLAKVSNGQKKLIHQATKTITHNADGTGSFTASASFNLELTLSGTYYSKVNIPSTTWTLNTIPRKSTLTSGQSWTAGSNTIIKISRASSSFTHKVTIKVNGTTIKTITGVGASSTVSFTTSENTSIFTALAQTSSKATSIVVETFSGSTSLGSNTYSGTCTCPTTSTMTWQSSVNIGGTISGTITRKNGAFVHNCQIAKSDNTKVFQLYTNAGTSYSFDTSSIASSLYALCPNSNSVTLKIRMWTMYNGVQVGAERNANITFKVTNSNPTFSPAMTYWDGSHSSITGNNQKIIQNVSNVYTQLLTSEVATAKNGASISYYTITLGSVTRKVSHPLSAHYTANLGKVNASSNQTIVFTAVDSRGNKTSTTKTVQMIPFQPTTITARAERANNFEEAATLYANGTFSPLWIDGVQKHDMSNVVISYTKTSQNGLETTGSTYTVAPTIDTTNGTFSLTHQFWNINSSSTATFKISIETPLTYAETSVTIKKGQPLFFLDTKKNSMGFNDVPNENNQILINGQVKFGANNFSSTQGAVNLNNSDVIGANMIRFSDSLQGNNNEGFLFPNTGTVTDGVLDNSECSNMYMVDGQVWIQKTCGSGKVVNIGNADIYTPLWTGALYMQGSHTITLPRNMNNYPNGIVLVWSHYDPSAGTTGNYDFVFSHIPKQYTEINNGCSVMCPMPTAMSDTSVTYTIKIVHVYINKVVGHDFNVNNTGSKNAVLRYILGY